MTQSTIYNLQSTIRRIAVFRALYLGDLLCAIPALRLLRRRFPEAEITFIGLAWAAAFMRRFSRRGRSTERSYIDRFVEFAGYPGIQEIAVDPERTGRFLAEARATSYDLAIQMHGDGCVSNGLVADLGARLTLGYRRGVDERLSFSLEYQDDEHEVLRWVRLIDSLEIEMPRQSPISDLQSLNLEFPTTPEEQAQATTLLAGLRSPVIGLHVGAKDPARRWPSERFAALADILAERWDASVVMTGSAGERDLTAAVRQKMRHPALDLAGTTDLGVFAAVIGKLDLLVTNDTGASHIAAATGTPSVALFGPSRPEQWAPLDRSRHRAVDALALASGVANPATALRRLEVAPVLEACEELLERGNDQRSMTNDVLQTIEVGASRSSPRGRPVVRRSP